ncbi:hypothetical protein AB0B45_46355 [Nonomuraea sp. NPDC049152]|uniref:hypothetical protein n=1 Tax=Nonomuraea sp. NPDC049152 TaxID=3154350 RepID=UPI0033D8D289
MPHRLLIRKHAPNGAVVDPPRRVDIVAEASITPTGDGDGTVGVAQAVGRTAVGAPLNGRVEIAGPEQVRVEIAGPEQVRMDEFFRKALAAWSDPHEVVTDPHARYFGSELSERSLVPGDGAMLGTIRYHDWLDRNATGK